MQPDLAYQSCRTARGLPGKCRFLHNCARAELLESFVEFRRHNCFIGTDYIGVCCLLDGRPAPHLGDDVVDELLKKRPTPTPTPTPRPTTRPKATSAARPNQIRTDPTRRPAPPLKNGTATKPDVSLMNPSSQ